MRRLPSTTRTAALLGATVALFATTAASCGDQDQDIGLGSAERGAVVEVVDAPAAVTARAAATLTAAAEGTLRRLDVESGVRVRAGQVLGVIDSPSARSQLTRAKKALNAARRGTGGGGGGVDLSGLRRETDAAAAEAFAQARALAARVGDPQLAAALLAQVKTAERRYAVAAKAAGEAVRAVQRGVAGVSSAVSALGTAQRLQAEQAYAVAKSTVDSLTLRAPIGGVIQLGGPAAGSGSASIADLLGGGAGALAGLTGGDSAASGVATGTATLPGVDGSVPVGGRVTAGTAILTVVDVGELGLLAEVDETDILLVRPGTAATVELDAATGATYEATVRTVDVLPTPSTRGGVSYRVRLALDAGRYADGRAAPTPRPGMSAVVHLRVREASDAVSVPAAAVFSTGGRDAVWVVRDGRASRVEVTVGVQGQDVVQIVTGLSPGDRVVVRGTELVEQGQQLP